MTSLKTVLLLSTILLFSGLSTANSNIIPYDGMEISTESSEMQQCEDGSEWEDTMTTQYQYLDTSDGEAILYDPQESQVYSISLDNREINPLESDLEGKTGHWINTDVSTGDQVQVGQEEYTVASTSDTIYLRGFGQVEAIRLEDTWNVDGEVIDPGYPTRPETPRVTENIWFDAYSGLYLKEETESEFESRLSHGWISCEISIERNIVETEQDTSKDGTTDLTKILENRENPLEKEVNLEIDVADDEIKQYEETRIEVSSEGHGTEPELYLDGEKIGEGNQFDIVFSDNGRHELEVRKNDTEVNGLIHTYNSDSEEIVVTGLTHGEQIMRTLSTLGLSNFLDSNNLQEEYLIITPAETSGEATATLGLQNPTAEDVTEEISLNLNGETETQEITVDSRQSDNIQFNIEESSEGQADVSSRDLSSSLEVKQGTDFEVESIESPEEVAEMTRPTIEIEAANNGDLAGKYNIPITINGEETERTLYIEPDSSNTVEVSFLAEQVGTLEIEADGETEEIQVRNAPEFEVEEINLETEEVVLGNDVEGTVEVTNTGGIEGTYELDMMLDGNTLAGESVFNEQLTIDAGDTEQTDFSIERDVIGNHNLTVDDVSQEIEVQPYIWEATTAEGFDDYYAEIINEKEVFNQGETLVAVFRYSVAQEEEYIDLDTEDVVTIYGSDGEVIDSTTASGSEITETQDAWSRYQIPTNTLQPGEYTVEFQARAINKGATGEAETSFIIN